MKQIILLAVAAFLALNGVAAASPCDDWNILEKEIRDGRIDRISAKTRIAQLHRLLLDTYGTTAANSAKVFPVADYDYRAIGGRHGNDYRPGGYSFYQGVRHGGHPAHDIFVHDRNQDSLDDATGKPVTIVASANGVVIATNPSWDYPSPVRGGKYVWIFNTAEERYYYYAHLSSVTVMPGQTVTAGEPIGFLGRTGKNAYPRRSPTHLHFMVLSYADGRMLPINPYRELVGAGRGIVKTSH
ncbi:Peptidase M23 [Geobacter metallireducens RCH3]|uniref:Zinc metalloendopeptidase, M23 family n=1 Tax=Geobacter metallireducens (strain ATCC 53774 / DSM 7210 / GS-15) TaxID=269799 RepID=Q39V12_GEOMG|nr:M23 family metallopeptidase [Geobacter metallireducens]ABB31912.1 zinc metalloendopeptidase, M23 family [Geobacter metallireducens GS-15]EHP89204.1 Peptidase M23 [Geobacter metallireducens RCH3]